MAAALLACTAGMGWLALAMETHWGQVRAGVPSQAQVRRLRALGVAGLAGGLGLCLAVDHPSMAALVWVMALAVAALLVAMVLTWWPRWLRLLAWLA